MRVVTEDKMTIAKVEVERFSLTSSKPFDAIVAALKSAIGQPDMVEFFKETRATKSFPDLERVVESGLLLAVSDLAGEMIEQDRLPSRRLEGQLGGRRVALGRAGARPRLSPDRGGRT